MMTNPGPAVNGAIRATITKMARRLNTHDGNPVWAITFSPGSTLVTKRDSSFVYGIDSNWVGREVDYWIDERVRIVDVVEVEAR